jgi:hypothetical protein
MTCDNGNPGSGIGQAQRCGRVKPVHVYGTIFLISVYITGEHMTIRQAQRCGRVKPVLVYGTLFLIRVYISGEQSG